jgi:hypothetical protein
MADEPFQQILQSLNRIRAIEEFRELHEGVERAIKIASIDPDMGVTRARKVLESVVLDVYQRRYNEPPGGRSLENLLQRLVKDGAISRKLYTYADGIRNFGNAGAHGVGEKLTTRDVVRTLEDLILLLDWYFDEIRPDVFAKQRQLEEAEREAERELRKQAEENQRREREEEERRRLEEEQARKQADAAREEEARRAQEERRVEQLQQEQRTVREEQRAILEHAKAAQQQAVEKAAKEEPKPATPDPLTFLFRRLSLILKPPSRGEWTRGWASAILSKAQGSLVKGDSYKAVIDGLTKGGENYYVSEFCVLLILKRHIVASLLTGQTKAMVVQDLVQLGFLPQNAEEFITQAAMARRRLLTVWGGITFLPVLCVAIEVWIWGDSGPNDPLTFVLMFAFTVFLLIIFGGGLVLFFKLVTERQYRLRIASRD